MLPSNENFEKFIKENRYEKWYFYNNENYYKLLNNDFSSNNYLDNKLCYDGLSKTKCKLKVEKCQHDGDILKHFEEIEHYEMCKYIRDNG